MIRTVFPTPAPPKSPILPPFWYGARRSTTYKKDLHCQKIQEKKKQQAHQELYTRQD